MFSKINSLLLIILFCMSTVYAANSPKLGNYVEKQEIMDISLNVLPDGSGLPQGSGTAKIGEGLYNQQCIACHGAKGVKGPQPALAGQPTKGVDWSTGSAWPYATSIFDYIRRAMPPFSPKKLSDDDLYAITAYVLYLNGVVEFEQLMNSSTLPKTKMPALKYTRSKWEEGEKQQ